MEYFNTSPSSSSPVGLSGTLQASTDQPLVSEIFYASKNISVYWEQNVADYINLVYIPICCFIGITGNTVAFFVLVLSSLRNTTTCLYMAVISCLDTLVLILNICFFVRQFPGFEIFNHWSCGLIMFLFYFTIHFDVLLLVAMTLERYIAVTYPLHAPKIITTKKTVRMICVIGILSFSLNIFNVFTRDMIEVVPGVEVCSVVGQLNLFFVDKIFTWIDSAIYCFIPVISLFTINVKMIKNLKKASSFQKEMIKPFSQHGSISNLSATVSSAGLKIGFSSKSVNQSRISSGQTANLNSATRGEHPVSSLTKWKSFAKASLHKTTSSRLKTEAKNQQQVTLMLILVSFAFLILAAPGAVIRLVEKYVWIAQNLQDRARHNLRHAIIDNLMYTNHAVNFVLYMLSGQKFRTEFKRTVCQWCGHLCQNSRRERTDEAAKTSNDQQCSKRSSNSTIISTEGIDLSPV